jgi:Domain of unknown function (DUF3331)
MNSAGRSLLKSNAKPAEACFASSPADARHERAASNELESSQPERQKSHQWSQIAKALEHGGPAKNHIGAPYSVSSTKSPASKRRQIDFDIHNINVVVLDRPTSSTVLISWKDSTRCNYGYQLWHLAKSRKSGICALSGKQIKVGDLVYRPYAGRLDPLNAGAMILAVSIHERSPYISASEMHEENRFA